MSCHTSFFNEEPIGGRAAIVLDGLSRPKFDRRQKVEPFQGRRCRHETEKWPTAKIVDKGVESQPVFKGERLRSQFGKPVSDEFERKGQQPTRSHRPASRRILARREQRILAKKIAGTEDPDGCFSFLCRYPLGSDLAVGYKVGPFAERPFLKDRFPHDEFDELPCGDPSVQTLHVEECP